MKYQKTNQSKKHYKMKHTFALLILVLVLVSCGGEKKTKSVEDVITSQDLNQIRA